MSDQPGTEIAVHTGHRTPDTDTWVAVIRQVITLAEHVADTDFVPRPIRGNAPAVTAVILHGRELGLPPMTALAVTHFIDGRPTLSAESQRGLVLAAGHEIELVESTDAAATWRGRRHGDNHWTVITWRLDDARRAGLLGRNQWKSYPREMLSARASASLCRAIFSDVLHGMAAAEEMQDDDPTNGNAPAATKRARITRGTGPVAEPAPAPEPPMPDPEPVPAPSPPDVAPAPLIPDHAPPVTQKQLKLLGVMWSRFGVTDEERRHMSGQIAGRDIGDTTKNLTQIEASTILDALHRLLDELAPAGADPLAADATDPVAARTRLDEWLAGHVD